MPAKYFFAAITLAAFAVPVAGQLQEKQPPAPMPAQKTAPLKTYDFKFSNTKWDAVVDWFKDISELTFIGPNMPTGYFSCKPCIDKATGKPKQFTVKEIVAVLNEQLAAQKWVLMRKQYSFMIHPIDVPLPREGCVPLITLDKLDQDDLDDGDFVQVTFQPASTEGENLRRRCGENADQPRRSHSAGGIKPANLDGPGEKPANRRQENPRSRQRQVEIVTNPRITVGMPAISPGSRFATRGLESNP